MSKINTLSVFLSHSHKDIDRVRKIRNIMESVGIDSIMFYLKCLDDDNEILEDFIKKEIEARNVFIYCKSKNSENSKWVQMELEYIRQIDKNRLYEIDIDDSFELSMVNTLTKLSHIMARNTILLCHSKQENRVLIDKIEKLLSSKGYAVEHIILSTTVPSMNKLEFWEFQQFKNGFEDYLNSDIFPTIQKIGNKAIFAPILSNHLFKCDDQWASLIWTKISRMCTQYNCKIVPMSLTENMTDGQLLEIVDAVYLKTIEPDTLLEPTSNNN